MLFNISAIQYALLNKLHVEYFIWVYLRNINDTGLYDPCEVIKEPFYESTVSRCLKNNIFYAVSNGKIILHAKKKIDFSFSRKNYYVDFNEITKFANKVSINSPSIAKGWNSTTIKYLMISIFASRYEDGHPYALQLISQDTNCSISTIQRALKVFGVTRDNKVQNKPSHRGYMTANGPIYLSPNYYKMPIGYISKMKN